MNYAANDVWGQWNDNGAGATVTVTNGILNIADPSNATNGSKYIQLTARGGDKIVFRTMARAISGIGRLWINLNAIGGVVAGEVPITGNAEFDSYAIEYTIPHSYAAVDVYIGVGCTTADVGTIEAYAPTVYLNGTAVDFLMGYAGVAARGGNFGIGLMQPTYKLHISGGGNPSVGVSYYENGTGGAAYIGVKYRGTASAPAAVQANDFISSLLAAAYTGSGVTGNIGLAGFQAAENITSSAQGTEFIIGVTPIGSTGRVERVRVRNNGNVRPGVDNAQSLGETALRWSNVFAYNVTLKPPASVTPANNGDMTFELTSDTQLKIKVKGSDGTVRSVNLTLA